MRNQYYRHFYSFLLFKQTLWKSNITINRSQRTMHAFKVKFECSVLVSHEKFSCRNQVVFILLYSPAYPIETSCVLFNECIRWKITGLIFQRGFIVSLRGYQDELYNYILLFRSRFFLLFVWWFIILLNSWVICHMGSITSNTT